MRVVTFFRLLTSSRDWDELSFLWSMKRRCSNNPLRNWGGAALKKKPAPKLFVRKRWIFCARHMCRGEKLKFLWPFSSNLLYDHQSKYQAVLKSLGICWMQGFRKEGLKIRMLFYLVDIPDSLQLINEVKAQELAMKTYVHSRINIYCPWEWRKCSLLELFLEVFSNITETVLGCVFNGSNFIHIVSFARCFFIHMLEPFVWHFVHIDVKVLNTFNLHQCLA